MGKTALMGLATVMMCLALSPAWTNGTSRQLPSHAKSGALAVAFLSEPKPAANTFTVSDRLIMASYYPWYGHKNPRWGEEEGIDHPLVGSYNSSDPKLIDYHLSLAQDAGLDAFLVSWGGAGNIYDERFRQMLEQVKNSLRYRKFKVGIYYENVANRPHIPDEKLIAEFSHLLREYGRHPAYLRVDGKPVIFVYTPEIVSVERWKTIFESVTHAQGPAVYVAAPDGWDNISLDCLGVFDSIAPYADKYYKDETVLKAYSRIADRGKMVIATIIGGGSRVQKLGFDFDRSDGKYIRQRFNLAQKGNAKWLYITSWNEWFEAMQIEPSREYGFEGIKYTREIAAHFKGVKLDALKGAALSVASKRHDAGAVEVTVSNTGKHNVYRVTCKIGEDRTERLAYVLHPGEKETLFIRTDKAAPRVEVNAYLPDNTTVHASAALERPNVTWKQYDANPFVFKLAQQRPHELMGGILAADLNNDGLLDYLYTTPGSVGAYDHFGKTLWVKQVDIHLLGAEGVVGLPGIHGPGVQAADMDSDGKTEVLFLKTDGSLVICDGATGEEKQTAKPLLPEGAAPWQHLVVCNLRGKGERDIVLQTSGEDERPAGTFPAGRFVSAFAMEDLEGNPLWSTDRFHGLAHGGLKLADIDGDGRDEVCGLSLYDHDGTFLTDGESPPEAWHIDSLFIYDVRPDLKGLEVLLLEEGTDHVMLLSPKGRVWRTHHQHQEPQNAVVGEFDLSRPGLEIWCRSRDDTHQKPWVFDAQGNVIASYELSSIAPPDWTVKGLEEIWAIDWTGEPKQLAAAKERHKEGDVCIFDPMTGKFIERFKEQAARLYVADVAGDWREELVVVHENEVRVYWNPTPNPNPNRARLWTQNHYRRSKMNWNYYSL